MYITLKNLEVLKKLAITAGRSVDLDEASIVAGYKAYTRTRWNVRVQVIELTDGHLVETMVAYILGVLKQLRVIGYVDVSARLDARKVDVAINNTYFQLKYNHVSARNEMLEYIIDIPVIGIPSVARAKSENVAFSDVLIKMLLMSGVSTQVIKNIRCATDIFEAADKIWQWVAR